jgi:phospholipase/carboxylesterase
VLGLAVVPGRPSPAVGQEDPTGATQPEPETLWHEAKALFPMRVYLPPDFDATGMYPAVVALHGLGGSADRFGRIGRAFAEAGFIVAIPEGPYRIPSDEPGRHSTWELSTWTDEMGLGAPLTDDLAIESRSAALTIDEFLPSVIDRIRDQYLVNQVYLFGFSLGGVYAMVGGFFNRHQVDGIIAFGATFYEEFFTGRGDRLAAGNRLPIRLGLGRSDPMVPLSNANKARAAFEAAGYQVTLDAFPGGHAVPDDALARAVAWLVDIANP